MEHNPSSISPVFNSIPAEKWIAAEAPIHRVLNQVRPTSDSEDKRNDVVRYMRLLIEKVGGTVELAG
ncbi:hypothetical protein Hdeb2414_s0010g00355831 [Helianthus debilis subsp. tardiflorus]